MTPRINEAAASRLSRRTLHRWKTGADAIMVEKTYRVTSRFHRDAEPNDGVVAGYQISATLDLSTCLKCASLDGRVFPRRTGPRPPFHRDCRCSAVPVAKSWEDLGIDLPSIPPGQRASMYGPVPGEWRYFDWLAKRYDSEIERVLGKKLSAVFLRGGLTPAQFAGALLTPRHRLRTITELRAEIPEAFRRAGLE